jgi:transcriptional/translational regulatory protein YebC/TACO1
MAPTERFTLRWFVGGGQELLHHIQQVARPENPVTLSGEDAAKMQKLLDVLEDLDDVQNVFHNAEFED